MTVQGGHSTPTQGSAGKHEDEFDDEFNEEEEEEELEGSLMRAGQTGARVCSAMAGIPDNDEVAVDDEDDAEDIGEAGSGVS